jgi:hypothetical protein
MTSVAVLRAVALVAILGTPALAQDAPQRPTITTPGEATIKRAPDRAWVVVATDAHAPKSDDARRLGAQAMTDVQTALKATGLAPDAIRTLALSVEPEMSYVDGRAKVNGYTARNQIEVRVDDLDKLPAVFDAASTPKNVTLSINGPRFDLKDRQAVEAEALAASVRNAMSRARAIATGANATLGAIIRIENDTPSSASPMPVFRMQAAMAAPSESTPIAPGEIEIQARVNLTIAIMSFGGK